LLLQIHDRGRKLIAYGTEVENLLYKAGSVSIYATNSNFSLGKMVLRVEIASVEYFPYDLLSDAIDYNFVVDRITPAPNLIKAWLRIDYPLRCNLYL
jgi:hypothetical protein